MWPCVYWMFFCSRNVCVFVYIPSECVTLWWLCVSVCACVCACVPACVCVCVWGKWQAGLPGETSLPLSPSGPFVMCWGGGERQRAVKTSYTYTHSICTVQYTVCVCVRAGSVIFFFVMFTNSHSHLLYSHQKATLFNQFLRHYVIHHYIWTRQKCIYFWDYVLNNFSFW